MRGTRIAPGFARAANSGYADVDGGLVLYQPRGTVMEDEAHDVDATTSEADATRGGDSVGVQ